MKKRIGLLTSGGDCPGLNATIRGVGKAVYERIGRDNVEMIGIEDGYHGLIHGESHVMEPSDFSGILTMGGTILGTSRQPYSKMQVVGEDNINKVENMKKNYESMKLDCLLTLGGNGTHKTANLLANEGLNVIGLPKTIDNDIFGTDITFGFHTAVDTATDVIDKIHTTASSHKRVMLVEIMGNKAGWLTLYSGLAGGADIILIPEIPYHVDSVMEAIERRGKKGRAFSIIAVAEGAMEDYEADMKKKERSAKRSQQGYKTATQRLADQIAERSGYETRVVISGHIVRGGSPSAYDRVLATQFGVYAASLIEHNIYGVTVAMQNNMITHNPLSKIAGITKFVPREHQMVNVARNMGICMGD